MFFLQCGCVTVLVLSARITYLVGKEIILVEESSYQERAQNYISSVIQCISKLEYVVSVVVFGSYVKGDLSQSSDVDVLVIVSDSTPSHSIMALNDELKTIQLRLDLTTAKKSFSNKLLNLLSKQTGMFVSGFICTESAFKNLDFTTIFKTNRFLTELFAPKNLVLSSMVGHAKTICGKDLIKELRAIDVSSLDLRKSLVMNLMLSLGAILLAVYKPNESMNLSMEAVKWSMYNTFYYSTHKNLRLSYMANEFLKHGISSSHIRRMMQSRRHAIVDKKFILLTLLNVIRIHRSHKVLKL